jgi:hypothetical protein
MFQNVSSPLLEEVERARRATVGEEDAPTNLTNEMNLNSPTTENEEKELIMSFHFLTLKYKNKSLEEQYSSHISPNCLLIIEMLLSIISLLLIYIYFPIKFKSSMLMIILISIKLILSLILICFHRLIVKRRILRHVIGSFYLLSPLLIILLNLNDSFKLEISLLSFVVFLSSYLTIGASFSHLIKLFVAFVSILIYVPLIIHKQQIQSLFF